MTDVFREINSLEELQKFPSSIATMRLVNTAGRLTEGGVTRILELCEALWIHSGDPRAPHAGLTSGQCSDGFVDVLRALRYTNVCDILAYHMASAIDSKLDELGVDNRDGSVRWVIGSDHAGAVFSQNVARWFGSQHDFTEKGPGGTQLWKRLGIKPSESVLQVEELMTTSGTLQAVREGVRRGNPSGVTFSPLVGVLVHRSDVYEIEGAPVVFLAHYDIKTWFPDKCPLCQGGSKRISEPKKNWAELTGTQK